MEAESWHVGIALAVLLLCLEARSPVFREIVRYTLQGLALFVDTLQSRGIAVRMLGSVPPRWIALISYTFLSRPPYCDPNALQTQHRG